MDWIENLSIARSHQHNSQLHRNLSTQQLIGRLDHGSLHGHLNEIDLGEWHFEHQLVMDGHQQHRCDISGSNAMANAKMSAPVP
jgi:hypothetical protein